MDVRIILHAVNGGRDGSDWSVICWKYHESNLQMRARAGHLWIVTVDSATPEHSPCSAPSGVVGPDGRWRCRVDAIGQQFFTYEIELEA